MNRSERSPAKPLQNRVRYKLKYMKQTQTYKTNRENIRAQKLSRGWYNWTYWISIRISRAFRGNISTDCNYFSNSSTKWRKLASFKMRTHQGTTTKHVKHTYNLLTWIRLIIVRSDILTHWRSIDSFASSWAISETNRIRFLTSLGDNVALLASKPTIIRAPACTATKKKKRFQIIITSDSFISYIAIMHFISRNRETNPHIIRPKTQRKKKISIGFMLQAWYHLLSTFFV